jgi:SHS2 domain-containing protein
MYHGRAMPEKRPFRVLGHTADVALEVSGHTLPKLFENAASGFYALLVKADKIRDRLEISLAIRAHDREALLVRFLQELNYMFQTQRIVGARVEVKELGEKTLTAVLWGEPMDAQRYTVLREIKAVTHHGLTLKKTPQSWKARIIFDI